MNNTNPRQAQARALRRSRSFGVLATNSQPTAGVPSASIVAYALDAETSPVFLFSSLALHAQNLRGDPHASLLFGEVREIPESEADIARDLFVTARSDAVLWARFGEFSLYRMAIARAYFVGGFGVMGWMDADDLLELA